MSPRELKPPKRIKVGPVTFQVVADRDAAARVGLAEGGAVYGFCHGPEQRITLDPEQGPDQMADTLIHEPLHAINDQVRLWPKGDKEEDAIRRLAPWLVMLIRDNPQLVDFIRDSGKGAA